MSLTDQAIANLQKAEEYIKCGLDTLPEYAAEYVKLCSTEENDSANDYKQLIKTYIQMEQDLTAYKNAALDLKKMLNDNDLTSEESQKRLDTLYGQHLKQQTSVGLHPAYTAVMKLFNAGGSDGEDLGDEDLAIEDETVSLKCPYTGIEMIDPVKNTNCGHSYDMEGIRIYIKQRGKHARCPVSSCADKTPIALKCLVVDKKLKAEIEKRKKQS